MKKILVTGASGLLGSHVVRLLHLDPEFRPVPLVRTKEQATEWEVLGLDPVIADLRNPPFNLPVDLWGVVHTAAIAGDWVDADLAYAVNRDGVRHLVEAAALTQCQRFVHISTIGVYGHARYDRATEDRKYGRSSTYENSKVAGEKVILGDIKAKISSAVEDFPRMTFVVLRPPSMYGEGDRHVIPKFTKYIERGKFLFVGGGKSLYPVIHAADAARAVLLALQKPDLRSGERYHICDDSRITLRGFVEVLAQNMGMEPEFKSIPYWPAYLLSCVFAMVGRVRGKEPWIFPKRIKYLGRTRNVDITKARKELGFEPEINPAQGIPRTLEWLREEQTTLLTNQKAEKKEADSFLTVPFHLQKALTR